MTERIWVGRDGRVDFPSRGPPAEAHADTVYLRHIWIPQDAHCGLGLGVGALGSFNNVWRHFWSLQLGVGGNASGIW